MEFLKGQRLRGGGHAAPGLVKDQHLGSDLNPVGVAQDYPLPDWPVAEQGAVLAPRDPPASPRHPPV